MESPQHWGANPADARCMGGQHVWSMATYPKGPATGQPCECGARLFNVPTSSIPFEELYDKEPLPPQPIEQRARELVGGDRQEAYGHPSDNHTRTGILWNAYLDARKVGGKGGPLGPQDVCWLNVLQKIAREINAEREDNLVDVIGYTLNVDLIRRAS